MDAPWAELTPSGQRHAIFTLLQDLNRKADQLMSDQSQIDADVTAITAADQAEAASIADIVTQLTSIQADLAASVAAGQAPDLTKLNAFVTEIQATQAAAAAADTAAQADATADAPPAPAPAPDPTPAPVDTPPAA